MVEARGRLMAAWNCPSSGLEDSEELGSRQRLSLAQVIGEGPLLAGKLCRRFQAHPQLLTAPESARGVQPSNRISHCSLPAAFCWHLAGFRLFILCTVAMVLQL